MGAWALGRTEWEVSCCCYICIYVMNEVFFLPCKNQSFKIKKTKENLQMQTSSTLVGIDISEKQRSIMGFMLFKPLLTA